MQFSHHLQPMSSASPHSTPADVAHQKKLMFNVVNFFSFFFFPQTIIRITARSLAAIFDCMFVLFCLWSSSGFLLFAAFFFCVVAVCSIV